MEQDVAVSKYVVRFTLAYLFLIILLAVVETLLELDSNSGGAIAAMVAALLASAKFVEEHKRIPSKSEKRRLVWYSFAASWGVSLLLFIPVVMLTGEGGELLEMLGGISPGLLLGVVLFISLLSLALISFGYGSMAKSQLKALQKKERA